MTVPTYTASDLTQAINKTWPSYGDRPRHVTAFEVNGGAGFSYSRRLDAVVLDTWPSGGFFVHGLEVKVSAGDLRRELQDTTKFADFAGFLDLFSIVAPPGVVKLELLPESWGLYVLQEDGALKARRKPLMLHDGRDTEMMPRSFAAAFCRALECRSRSKVAEEAAYQRGHKDGLTEQQREDARKMSALEARLEAVRKFEAVSGVSIRAYCGDQIGEAVKTVLTGGLDRRLATTGDLHRVAADLEKLACELDGLKTVWRER